MNHKEWVATVFDRAASDYDNDYNSYFHRAADRLIEAVKPNPTDSILDAATGRGAIAFSLVEKLKFSGPIVGVDISPNMVQETSKKVHEKQLHNISLQVMDVESLTFENQSFDTIFCAFSLFFLPNPDQALCEFKRVLKSKGRLAVSTWGARDPLDIWFKKRASELGASKSLQKVPFETLTGLQDFCKKGSFEVEQLFSEQLLHTYENAESCWNAYWSHAMRTILEQLDENSLQELKKEFMGKVAYDYRDKPITKKLTVNFLVAH